jgi:putative membrane protein insertion efficiency factor
MIKTIFVFPIKIYQKLISPFIGSSCRFTPTCSHYAIEVIDKFGIIKGTLLSIKRILKCNPFGSSGYDPIPD